MRDGVKAKQKRRLVFGLREVQKLLRVGRIKGLVVAPDIERITAEGVCTYALHKYVCVRVCLEIHIICVCVCACACVLCSFMLVCGMCLHVCVCVCVNSFYVRVCNVRVFCHMCVCYVCCCVAEALVL